MDAMTRSRIQIYEHVASIAYCEVSGCELRTFSGCSMNGQFAAVAMHNLLLNMPVLRKGNP